jgi:hypothetical protein
LARELDDIVKELDAGYAPERQLINDAIARVPGETDTEVNALGAQEADYYDNTIMADARRRGIGFSGIPTGERARYGATQFLPAVARARSAGADRKLTLSQALIDSQRTQREKAMGLRQTELDRDEATRQFNEQLAANERERAASRASSFNPSFATPTATPTQATATKSNSLQSYLSSRYASSPNVSRTTQDNWVREWARQNGINPDLPNDPNGIWAAYNQLYPYEKFIPKSQTKAPAGTVNLSSPQTGRSDGLKITTGKTIGGLKF